MDAMDLYETAGDYETIRDIMRHYEKSDIMRQHETLLMQWDSMREHETL